MTTMAKYHSTYFGKLVYVPHEIGILFLSCLDEQRKVMFLAACCDVMFVFVFVSYVRVLITGAARLSARAFKASQC